MPGPAPGAQGYGHRGGGASGWDEGQARGRGASPSLRVWGGRQPMVLISTPGNIRVLCRLRPGTPSSLVSSEPGPGGTVTTCYRGHRRRFRLDWVFPPDASQEEVMLDTLAPAWTPPSHVEPPQRLWCPCLALPSSQELDSSREGGGRAGGRTGSRAGATYIPSSRLSPLRPLTRLCGAEREQIWFGQEGSHLKIMWGVCFF